jgi:hypothetical protein
MKLPNDLNTNINLQRANTARLNTLASVYIGENYSTINVDVGTFTVKTRSVRPISEQSIEQLCYTVITYLEKYRFSSFEELGNYITYRMNTHKIIYPYVADTLGEKDFTHDVLYATINTYVATRYLLTEEYPEFNEINKFMDAMKFPEAVQHLGRSIAYMWIITHKRGWWAEVDKLDLTWRGMYVIDPTLPPAFATFNTIVDMLGFVGYNANQESINVIAGATLLAMEDNTKHTFWRRIIPAFATYADLSEHNGAFYSVRFMERYLNARENVYVFDGRESLYSCKW